MCGEGMGGICQSSLAEGIGCEEIGEFVVDGRNRPTLDRREKQVDKQGQRKKNNKDNPGPVIQFSEQSQKVSLR
jgi:hypothetical protein